MDTEGTAKKCSACGGETVYVQDVDLTEQRFLMDEWTRAALYRCPDCGHFDLYERTEEREARKRAEEYDAEYAAMPDYRCPSCGRVGKFKRCPFCRVACTPADEKADGAPESPRPEKKRRWFGRDDDKPDWEG